MSKHFRNHCLAGPTVSSVEVPPGMRSTGYVRLTPSGEPQNRQQRRAAAKLARKSGRSQ